MIWRVSQVKIAMKYFTILVIIFTCCFQNGLSDPLIFKENSLNEKYHHLYNEDLNLETTTYAGKRCVNDADCGKKEACEEGNDGKGKVCTICDCEKYSSRGKCVLAPIHISVCKCPPGKNITVGYCIACDCGPRSNCTFKEGTAVKICLCKQGYEVRNGMCIGPCTYNPCLNGGICEDVQNGYKCLCPSEYTGTVCADKSPCMPNPCINDGKCEIKGLDFICTCPKPWRGKTCELDSCMVNPCKNDGKCEIKGLDFICTCTKPWRGKTCELGPCMPNPCINDGKCEIKGLDFICTCPKPWRGKTCELACVCKGGECVSEDGEVVCRCPPGFGNYTTSSCKACDCGPDSNCMWPKVLGGKICFCKPGYYDKLGKCVDCECGTDSNCTLISEGWLKPAKKVCHCKLGFYEENGKCVELSSTLLPTSKTKISSVQTTVTTPQAFETPRTTPKTEIDICIINPCKNDGICKPHGGTFLCYCKNPYFGKLCEKSKPIFLQINQFFNSTIILGNVSYPLGRTKEDNFLFSEEKKN